MKALSCIFVLAIGLGLPLSAEVRIVPQLQYCESRQHAVELSGGGAVAIRAASGEKVKLRLSSCGLVFCGTTAR